MYGVRMSWREAKALFDRTKGRALLRFHAPNVYSVLDGKYMDACVSPRDWEWVRKQGYTRRAA